MKKLQLFKYGSLVVAMAACGGQQVAAQDPAPAGAPLDHVYQYELPSAGARVQAADTGVIRVNGTATVEVESDRATVTFAVLTEAKDASDAAAANAELMSRVLAAVRRDGAPGLDIETFGYGLNPRYVTRTENGERVQRIDGYTAYNNVRAETTDVNAVGGIIDAAIGAGANRVAQLTFHASDTRDAELEAIRRAVQKARQEAETVAAALGRTLGPPIDVNSGVQAPPMVRSRMANVEMAMDMAAPTPIEAGGQAVTAHVSIAFAIGPATGRR